MLKESLEKLDKDVMNLLTYSVNFVQSSLCRIIKAINRKKNQQTSRQNNEKKAAFVSLGVSYSTGYGSGRRRVTQPIFLCLVINR